MKTLFARIALGFGSLLFVGVVACSAAPGGDGAQTESDQNALCVGRCDYCRCVSGSMDMADDPCGKALLAAHCYGGNGPGTTTAYAWASDSQGAEFWATCPSSMVIPKACEGSPYYAKSMGNENCCIGNAPSGHVFVEFDPNCPGCKIIN